MEFDLRKIKTELIKIYEGFLSNHNDKKIISNAMEFEFNYSGITNYEKYFSKFSFTQILSRAIYNLQRMWGFGDDDLKFDEKDDLTECNKILEELKKFNADFWQKKN